MKKAITKIICVALVLCTIFALSTTALAAEASVASDLAKELLNGGHAEITVSSVDEAKSIRKEVQAYVDAVSTTSETRKVKATISQNSQLNMTLEDPQTEDFSEDEIVALCAEAGTTVESIDEFIKGKLSYDHEAAKNSASLTQSSTQLTAKGALSTGKAVCQGYANLFAVIAERAGIQSVKVRGYAGSEYHVMNVVRNADGSFMAVDVTSNDSSSRSWSLISFDNYCAKAKFVPTIDVETAFALKYGD